MENETVALGRERMWPGAVVTGAVLCGLLVISRYNYLLFHTLAEIFAVLIACGIFVIAWNAREFRISGYLLFLGIAYLFVGVIDMVHTLAYPGMSVFQRSDTDLAAQLWVAARYLEAFSFVAALLFIGRRLRVPAVLACYTAITALIFMSIFAWRVFPVCFVEGEGLTRLKIGSEYVICLALLGAWLGLRARKTVFDSRVYWFLTASLVLSAASELAFTLYTDPYGLSNLVGHLLKVVSFLTVYKAVIETGLRRPYAIIFKEFTESEKALKRERDFVSAVLDTVGALVIVLDREGRIVRFNRACEAMTGFSFEELRGRPFWDFVLVPEEKEQVKSAFAALTAGQFPSQYQNYWKAKGGDRRFIAWSNTALVDENNAVEYVIGTGIDVTERRLAEEAARKANERLEASVAERTRELVRVNEALREEIRERRRMEVRTQITNELLQLFVKASTRKEYLDAVVGVIRGWSECRHLGIRVLDSQGRIPYDSTIGFSKEFLETENNLSLATDDCACVRVIRGEGKPEDVAAMTPGGSFCLEDSGKFVGTLSDEGKARYRGACVRSGFLSIAVVPVRYRGEVVGAIHLADEEAGKVSAEKVLFLETMAPLIGEGVHRFNVEAELRRLNEELERRVADRTAQLKSANEELASFSYSVSHDLRAPLRAIDGYSRIMAEQYAGKLDAEAARLLNVIRVSTGKMEALIDSILTLFRLGRREMVSRPIDMAGLAKGVFAEIRASAPNRSVRLVCSEVPPAQGDTAMVRQIYANLFANAVKFTQKQPEAVVEVGGSRNRNENVYYVRDNGVGFDMRYAEKLFGAFQRLHGEEQFEGTGIGLAIVQRIVHRHGGRVWAEGKVGEGATFFFALPVD